MCGIAGYWKKDGPLRLDLLQQMGEAVAHRGQGARSALGRAAQDGFAVRDTNLPDRMGSAVFAPESGGLLALAHQRLAILDKSEGGVQPMQRGSLSIVFNGEVFNHLDVKAELSAAGHAFHTQSDTEVLLAAWQHWGLDCLPRLRGFFAFVLYDAAENSVFLVRDALGKAPLYVLQQPDNLYFASDIRPLLLSCSVEKTNLNEQAIADYLLWGKRDVQHQTFWQNIRSLPAASWLKLDATTGKTQSGIWWKMPQSRLRETDLPFAEAVQIFTKHLSEALQLRLQADSDIGFTLSGGLDSSSLLAMACAQAKASDKWPVLSVGYRDKKQDEMAYARKVASAFSRNITHVVLDGFEKTVLDDFSQFLDIQEEPYHDPVLYTDFLQQKKLKSLGVDVCIMGAGGDELLAGYPSFLRQHASDQFRAGLLHWPQATAASLALAGSFSGREWLGFLGKFFFKSPLYRQLHPEKSQKDDVENEGESLQHASALSRTILGKMGQQQMNYWLRSLQKTYMAIPVEPRLPFLDQKLVNFALQLPEGYLIRHTWPKYILRKAMEPLLPPEVVWRRRKMGFPFDTRAWLIENETAISNIICESGQNAWVDQAILLRHYRHLAQSDPQGLWRALCFSAWCKRMGI